MFEDTASALFGVEGLQVTGVEGAPGGWVALVALRRRPGGTRPGEREVEEVDCAVDEPQLGRSPG
jgi:hypothetical protein